MTTAPSPVRSSASFEDGYGLLDLSGIGPERLGHLAHIGLCLAPLALFDAFADFATPVAATQPLLEGAIDISKLKPVREPSRAEQAKAEQAKAKDKPKPPANPSRFWAQVATGRNPKALAFDWKHLQREGGALLARRDSYIVRWGQTHRLVTGPYKTEDEADKAVSALKKKGIDAFEFTSDEGQEVTPLK